MGCRRLGHTGLQYFMRTIICLLLICFGAGAGESTLDSQRQQALSLYKHLDMYLRPLFGCPTKTVTFEPSDCHAEQSTVDYASYSKAREAAKRLFQFRD